MPDYPALDVQQIYCPVRKKNVFMEVSYSPDENRLSITKCLSQEPCANGDCRNVFVNPKAKKMQNVSAHSKA